MKQHLLVALALLSMAAMAALAEPEATPGEEVEEATVAVVNEQSITHKAFVDRLIAEFGKQTLDAMIADALIAQEQRRLGIRIDPSEVDAFVERIVANTVAEERKLLRDRYGPRETLEEYYRRYHGGTLQEHVDEIRKLADGRRDSIRTELVVNRLVHYHDMTRETVGIQHVLVATQAQAEAILEQLKEGAGFDALAKRESIDYLTRSDGGRIIPFCRGDRKIRTGLFDEAFEEAAFALKVGEFSSIVKSGAGYHVLKKLEHIPARDVPYAELEEQIRQRIAERRVSDEERSLCFERLRLAAAIARTY